MLKRIAYPAQGIWNSLSGNRSISTTAWANLNTYSHPGNAAAKTCEEQLVVEFAKDCGLDDAGAESALIRCPEHTSSSDGIPHITVRFYDKTGRRLGYTDGKKTYRTFHVPIDKSLWAKLNVIV